MMQSFSCGFLSRTAFASALSTALTCTLAVHAYAAPERIPVSDMQQALAQAATTMAPVRGYFAGELSAYAIREFKTTGKTHVDIDRVGAHSQQDCARYRVSIFEPTPPPPPQSQPKQKALNESRQTEATRSVSFTLNYCVKNGVGFYPDNERGQ